MRFQAVRRVLEDRRFLWAVTLAAALLAFLGPLAAYDLWWHLKAGRMILESGAVPHADPFSFTAAGRPWTYHSWLAGVVLTLVWDAGGAVGMIWFRSLLLAAALMLAWASARGRGVGPGLAAVLVLASCLQLKMRSLARPYLFSFVLFMLFVLILQAACSSREPEHDGRRRPERAFLWGRGGRLLLLPLLMLLWVNLHAGFLAGLLVIGAYGVGEMARLALLPERPGYAALLLRDARGARLRAMLLCGVLSLAACVVTPNLAGSLAYPFRLMHEVKLVKRVQEWQPVPFSGQFAVFWGVVVVGALVILRSAWLSASAGRLRAEAGRFVTDVLLMAGFALLARQAVRHMAWLLLLAPSVLGWHLRAGAGAADARPGGDRPAYAYVALLLAFFIGAWPFITGGMPKFRPAPNLFPIKACDFMASKGLDYRPFNTYEWGGYLIWRAWPGLKVFVDGRCLVYGDEIMGQAMRVAEAGEGWQDVLRDRDVEMLIVRYRKKDCAHFFADSRWRCIYWDDVAIIALRDDVYESRADGLREFPLTVPPLFAANLEAVPPLRLVEELDAVLARDPECWTAQGYRARALCRAAAERPADAERLVAEALAAAKRAVELQKGHFEPWLALQEAATAAGRTELAERAARKVAKLKPAGQKD